MRPVVLPTIVEQDEIVEYLQAVEADVKARLSAIEASTGPLREYRSALITAAVTGQIDVRHHAPRLP